MGRKSFFTEKQVFEAADTLTAQGKEVSASALLKVLGGGSFTTIYKHLKPWQESRPTLARTAADTGLPEPAQAAFVAAWKVAASEAARELSEAREKADEEVKTIGRQLQETLSQIERLERDSEADAVQIEALNIRLAELEDELQKSEHDRAALRATAEHLKLQLEGQSAELQRIRQELQYEREQNQVEIHRQQFEAAEERKRHDDLVEKLRAVLQQAQDKAANQMQQVQQQVATLQKESEKVASDRALVTIKLGETVERLKIAEKKQESAGKEREAAIKEAAELKGQVQALTAQNAELMSKLGERPARPRITTEQMPSEPPRDTAADAKPAAEGTLAIILALQVSGSMTSPLGQSKLVRASIERNVLSRFSMKRVSAKDSAYVSSGEYELAFSPAADSSLDEQIQGMCRACKQEATKLNCSAKCEIKS